LGENISTINTNTSSVDCSKEVGLEINADVDVSTPEFRTAVI
jgi:hypothetical protein